MTDTLEIFGTTYANVAGFKATDDNSQTKTYIRPQGTKSITANGTGIDVAEYAEVDVAVPGSSPNLQTKTAIPSESAQVITADQGYDGLDEVDVAAISSTYVGSGIARRSASNLSAFDDTVSVPAGYYENPSTKSVPHVTAGTPTAAKGAVSNHAVTVRPSVTNPAGYIEGGTKNGTPVSVSASELVSGSQTITQNGTVDVTNLAEVVVNVPTGGGASFNSGTLTLAARTRDLTFTFDFDPAHFCIFADNASVPTDNAWKTVGFYIPVIGGDGYVNISYGPSNRGGALRQAQYISYDSATHTLAVNANYAFADTTFYWCAW